MFQSDNNRVVSIAPNNKEAWVADAPRPRRRSILREFAMSTSTHGLPGIARSQSKHNCIFWSVSFVIFTGVMIYFVTNSIMAYFRYPTQTSVSIVVERSQAFPAVTICNYQPVMYDRLIGPFVDYTNTRNLTNTTSTTAFTFEQATYLRDFLQYEVNRNESMEKYFFPLPLMLIECFYNDVPCTVNDFIQFTSSVYGSCYTFNAKLKGSNQSAVRRTTDRGGSGKLQLHLYTQSHLYTPYVAADVSAGMVAMVHDNAQVPVIDKAGIELAPGRKHKLGYKKRTSYYLPAPYSDCTNTIPLAMQAMFDRYAGADYAYSQDVCYTLCTQAYIYHECGCVHPLQWSARSVVLHGTKTIIDAPLCNATGVCHIDAASRLYNTSSIWDEFCSDCQQACSSVDFVVTPSSAAAPSDVFAVISKVFVDALPIRKPSNWSDNWVTEVQRNYIGIDVVSESSLVENYTQDPSLSAVDVLSNVGGQTGLWIGISFLSLMEFIEMVYRLTRYQYHLTVGYLRRRIRGEPR